MLLAIFRLFSKTSFIWYLVIDAIIIIIIIVIIIIIATYT